MMSPWPKVLLALAVFSVQYLNAASDDDEPDIRQMDPYAIMEPLLWMLGQWETTDARGGYPTIPRPFPFNDKLIFYEIGQPVFHVSFASDMFGIPRHRENGFIRFKPFTNHIAYIAAHNLGLAEWAEGEFNETSVHLESQTIGVITFTSFVHTQKIIRDFVRTGEDTMELKTYMETENTPLDLHLQMKYTKTKTQEELRSAGEIPPMPVFDLPPK
ncbi:peroxynitrite isomerase THAP4-like [Ptychodera flava]|uniref:peroxynitrite isomerase THAP4-like n=1 Tax=Ptychodera flava TaxID=63121 RepID=UPI00396A2A34